MNRHTYEFDAKLRATEGIAEVVAVESILLANIPGALSVTKSHMLNDKNGTDWWVEHNTGRHLSIDAKVRDMDWAATHPNDDDLALETWSVVDKKVGWTRDASKRCDYVLWLWKDTGRWCLIPFPMLCKVFSDNWKTWKKTYKTKQQHTPNFGGYHSECTFVPRDVLWREIYKLYA